MAGAGGQGVLTAAHVLCQACSEAGHDVVSSQLRGMSQRAGAVYSSVIVDGGVSPVLANGSADVVLGFEPVETVRALQLMSPRTIVFINTVPVIPFVLGLRAARAEENCGYPDVDQLVDAVRAVTPSVFAFAASELAVEAGSARTLSALMVGCLAGSGLLPCLDHEAVSIFENVLPPALRDPNRRAFARGITVGQQSQAAQAEMRG